MHATELTEENAQLQDTVLGQPCDVRKGCFTKPPKLGVCSHCVGFSGHQKWNAKPCSVKGQAIQ